MALYFVVNVSVENEIELKTNIETAQISIAKRFKRKIYVDNIYILCTNNGVIKLINVLWIGYVWLWFSLSLTRSFEEMPI